MTRGSIVPLVPITTSMIGECLPEMNFVMIQTHMGGMALMEFRHLYYQFGIEAPL
jgi:hypothetical protein